MHREGLHEALHCSGPVRVLRQLDQGALDVLDDVMDLDSPALPEELLANIVAVKVGHERHKVLKELYVDSVDEHIVTGGGIIQGLLQDSRAFGE